MKIGIDAKWYFQGPPSGMRVVRSLVDHILKLDDKNHYYLFLDRRHRVKDFPTQGKTNVTLCYVWAGNNLLSNLLLLPFLSRRYKLDALLYQNFISPFDSSKAIAYIHDVLFLSNPEYYTIYERLYFSPLKFLTRRSAGIITVSEEEKKRLMSFGFSNNEEKITVAHHGVDTSFVPIENYDEVFVNEVRSKYNLPDTFLLYVGRLNLRKNVDHLLRAVPRLKNKRIPLVIVGADNWKKSNHDVIIKKLGIQNRIYFTGAIYQDLHVIYAMSRVFCFPSYAESFGLPPLEAMASGVPVVVSNSTSLPEVCGEAAEYITPNNEGEIAMAIDKLLSDREFYAHKRRLGIAQAKKFTWEKAAEIVIRTIEKCVNSR